MALTTSNSTTAWEEFLRERTITRNAQGDRSVALFMITPIGASAPYFTGPDVWSTYRPSDTSAIIGTESLTPEEIVKSIFRTVDAFNSQLHAGLACVNYEARARLRIAFKNSPERQGGMQFYHGLLQSVVLDRCAWALTTVGDTDERVLNPLPAYATIPKQFERVHSLYRNWPSTIANFIKNWRTKATQAIHENEETTSPVEDTVVVNPLQLGRSIGGLASLVGGLVVSYADMQMAKMEYNFCLAALGLIGLVLRQRAQEAEKGDDTGERPKTVGAFLKEACPSLPDNIAKREDYQLLRPLYTIVAVSPICLLSSFLLDSEAPGQRVPLYLMVDLVRHPILDPDIRRCRVEHSLFNTVLDMAANGIGVYKSNMSRLFDSWKDEYSASHAGADQLTASISEETVESITKPFKAKVETPLAMVVAKRLAKSVAGTKNARLKPIDLTGDGEGPEWLADAISKAGAPALNTSPSAELINSGDAPTIPPSAENVELQGRGQRVKKPVQRVAQESEGKPLSKKTRSRRPRKRSLSNEEVESSCHDDSAEDEAPARSDRRGGRKRKGVSPVPSSNSGEGKRRKTSGAKAGNGGHKRRGASPPPLLKEGVKKRRTAAETDGVLEDAAIAERSKKYRTTVETDHELSDEGPTIPSVPPTEDHEGTNGKAAGKNRPILMICAESSQQPSRSTASDRLPSPPPNQPLEPSLSSTTYRGICSIPSEFSDDRAFESAWNDTDVTVIHTPATPQEKARLPTGKQRHDSRTSSGIVLNDDVIDVDASAAPRRGARPAYGRHARDSNDTTRVVENAKLSPQIPKAAPVSALHRLKPAFKNRPTIPRGVMTLEVVELDRAAPIYRDWNTAVVEIPVWQAMKADLRMIDGLSYPVTQYEMERRDQEIDNMYPRYSLNNRLFQRTLKTVHRHRWEGMSREAQRRLFQLHNIHVVGASSQKITGIERLSTDEPLELWRLREVVNIYQDRQCHDMTVPCSEGNSANRLRKASLKQLIDYMKRQESYEESCRIEDFETDPSERPPLKRSLNFLDIPLLGTGDVVNKTLDDVTIHTYVSPKGRDWHTRLELSSLATRWMLAATASAFSATHIDAAGYATWVHILSGEKIWWMARELKPPTEEGWAETVESWDAAYLKPGDDLYMRPGTMHAVLTVKDCFAIGGHFYSSDCFIDTLIASIYEHFWGVLLTNTEHTKCHLLLFKAVVGIAMQVESEELDCDYLNQEAISSLILFVMYNPQLEPELPEDATEAPWHGTDEYRKDHEIAAKAALGLAKRLLKEWYGFEGVLVETEDFIWSVIDDFNRALLRGERHYRVNQVCVCGKHRLDDSDEGGSSGDCDEAEGSGTEAKARVEVESEDIDAEGEVEVEDGGL